MEMAGTSSAAGSGGSSSGMGMSYPPEALTLPSNTDIFSRISEPAFVASIFTLLAIAIVAAGSRTFLRVYRFRTFSLDDGFLVLAVLFMVASTAIFHVSRGFTYTQINVSLGYVPPPADFAWQMKMFAIYDVAGTTLVWAAIYSVKFSFVFFFSNLIDRVRGMKILWWTVIGILCCAAPASMFLGNYICSEYTEKILVVCTSKGMVEREATYLIVTSILDIITDLLVISIPIALLWRVKLSLKRKLALMTVLSLSTFMIAIAIVRITLTRVSSPALKMAPPGLLPDHAPDSVWLFFWQQVEACTAVLMVSLTAFRSMLGQQRKNSKKSGYSGNSSASRSEKRASMKKAFCCGEADQSSPTAGSGAREQFSTAKETRHGYSQSFDRSRISHPMPIAAKDVPMIFSKVESASLPPPPLVSPRWQQQQQQRPRQHLVNQDKSWSVENESSEEIEMQGRRPARSDSFV